jgi:hypothetical protein
LPLYHVMLLETSQAWFSSSWEQGLRWNPKIIFCSLDPEHHVTDDSHQGPGWVLLLSPLWGTAEIENRLVPKGTHPPYWTDLRAIYCCVAGLNATDVAYPCDLNKGVPFCPQFPPLLPITHNSTVSATFGNLFHDGFYTFYQHHCTLTASSSNEHTYSTFRLCFFSPEVRLHRPISESWLGQYKVYSSCTKAL